MLTDLSNRQRVTCVLVVGTLILLSGYLIASIAVLKLKISYAEGQVAIFEQMRDEANASGEAQEIGKKLEYVVRYYPSGSKQDKGSQLDKLVERARSNAVLAILSRLRTVTSRDLGTDPQSWLNEYSHGNFVEKR